MLMLDLGNSRYKWIDAGLLEKQMPVARPYAGEDAAEALCREIMTSTSDTYWRVASVRGRAFNDALARAFERAGGKRLDFVEIPPQPPFRLAYADPGQFGIDRYLDLLATRVAYRCPAIVIDAGTAVTIDALDAAGDHAGGIIFPGLRLLRRSLGQGTDRIALETEAPSALFGDSTASCVSGGVFYGLQGAVRGIVGAMAQHLGGRATIITTGGDAGVIVSALSAHDPVIEPKLLFKAMKIL